MPAPEVDRVVRATDAVQIGAFRCPVGHPTFGDSGPIRNHCFVFPRTPVAIRHRDERPFAADPTLVTLYNQGQEYARTPISPEGDRCDWYAVSPPLLREALLEYDPRAADDERRPIRFAFTRVDALTYLRQRQLFNEAACGEPLDPLYVDESVMDLLDLVLQSAYGRTARPAVVGREARLVADAVCELLGRRFVDPLSLADIAADVGASMFHLCRTFRRTTGLTIHAYRTQLRLRSALDRLEQAECDLSRLALDLGFSSHSHFTASFRSAFGVPPSAVRARIRATS